MTQQLNEQLSTLPVRIKTLGGFMGQSIQTNAGDVQQWYGTWFHQVNLHGTITGDHCTEFIQVKEYELLAKKITEAHELILELVNQINDVNNGDEGTDCEKRLLRLADELQAKHGIK